MKYPIKENAFRQEEQNLFISHKGVTAWYEMPYGFDIDNVSYDLKVLALTLIFYPWDQNFYNHTYTRESSGDRIGMAYSGGADSTAMAYLLPPEKTVPFHHLRIPTTPTVFRSDNQEKAVQEFNKKSPLRNVIVIPSTFEDARIASGKPPGFMNDFSFFAPMVLMADEYNIGYLAQGRLLENSWLQGGKYYQDWLETPFYLRYFNIFERANIPLYLPITTITEAITTKICDVEGIYNSPCMRGVDGVPCMNCLKCFRKELIRGNLIDYQHPGEIMAFLKKRPLKQASGLIYGMNKHGFDIPEIKEYVDLPVDWMDYYYEETFRGIPEEFIEDLKMRLNKYTSLNEDDTDFKEWRIQ